MEDGSSRLSEPAVEVELPLPAVAVVKVRGEHDVSTKPQLEAALDAASAQPHILIDLSECSFMDSSVVTAVMQASERLAEKRVRLGLLIPPEAALARRVSNLTKLETIVPIHESRGAALADLWNGEHATRVRDRRDRFGDAETYSAECSCGWSGGVHGDARVARRESARHLEEQRDTRREG
jgi:anti-anti-sigma factor